MKNPHDLTRTRSVLPGGRELLLPLLLLWSGSALTQVDRFETHRQLLALSASSPRTACCSALEILHQRTETVVPVASLSGGTRLGGH